MKLTKRTIDAAEPQKTDYVLWDSDVRGFGCKITPAGGKVYLYKYRTRDGEDREETTFVDCEAWGRTAEVMNQYLSKGRPVFVEGRLKFDQWEDRETGKKRSKLKVVVENFQFVDSAGGGGNRASQPAPAGAATSSSDGPTHPPVDESEIPF